MIAVRSLDHLVISVQDVEISAKWYARVLGFKREDWTVDAGTPVRTSMKLEMQMINLRPIGSSKDEWFTGRHPVTGSDDLCFLTDAPPEAVVQHLQDCGVTIERGPVKARGARGELRSVYCRDPDGNLIEIGSYAIA